MSLTHEALLTIQLTEETLQGERLRDFLAFCLGESDEVALCCLHPSTQTLFEDCTPIKHERTHQTHCTKGPLTDVYYFKANSKIQEHLSTLSHLYAPLCVNAHTQLEDLAFYDQGRLVVSICSHEHFGWLYLTQAQYDKLNALHIPHDIFSPKPKLTLEEWLIQCAEQQRSQLTILGWHERTIPKCIQTLTTLKNLEIFDHEIMHLPESLSQLTQLEHLSITGNQVTDLGFNLAKLSKLKTLDLSGMPLKCFPRGIDTLTQLEALYIDVLPDKESIEALMSLQHLKVLHLPELSEDNYDPAFIDFVNRLKPKFRGIPLSEILGEEVLKEIKQDGEWIVKHHETMIDLRSSK